MIDRVPVDDLKSIAGKSRAKMTATLRSWGLPAVPDVDGWPIVLRPDLERALGIPASAPVTRKRPRLGPAGATM